MGGANLYGFVGNNPVSRFDALGLIDENSSLTDIEAEVRSLIAAGRRRGMNVAADNLANFLSGGGDRTLPVAWLRSFDKITSAETKNEGRFQKQLQKLALGMKCGESKTFADYWDAQITYGGRGFSSEELFWASGDSTLTSRGNFTLTKECSTRSYGRAGNQISCGTVKVTGTVDHNWRDVYDWNAGASVSIPGHGRIPDSAIDRLRTQGRAKTFNMTASWSRQVTGAVQSDLFAQESWKWSGP